MKSNGELGPLKKARAQFALQPLKQTMANQEDVPDIAVYCSNRAMNLVQVLYKEVEDKRKEGTQCFLIGMRH